MFATVHDVTALTVGFTEVKLFPHREDVAFQADTTTAVRAEHCGHGLGHWVKASMLHWPLAEHPHVEEVLTATGQPIRTCST